MAKPRITFTSLDGYSRTLQSDYPDPACRLRNFHADSQPIGDFTHDLAKEQLHRFRTSIRHGCHFEMPALRMGAFTASSAFAPPASIANELKLALLNGSTCALFTEDADGNSYATCGLMPGTTPELTLVNRRSMEYSLRLSLINLADTPVPMVCHYQTGYEREAYLVHQGANIYTFEYGAELVDADAWLKDEGSNIHSIDDSRAEKDRAFWLVDETNSLIAA